MQVTGLVRSDEVDAVRRGCCALLLHRPCLLRLQAGGVGAGESVCRPGLVPGGR
jgi:hypothetical protein